MSARLVPRAAMVVVTVVAMMSDAQAQEPVRHVVKANDTCSRLAQVYYGDARLVEVIHRANPVLQVPPPHSLREGMTLLIPPKPAEEVGPDAQLTAVRNQVDVIAPQTKQGRPNDPLFKGNRVNTHEAAAADVTFRDETQVKLGERTLVIILGDAKAAAARVAQTETRLVTGNLRAFLSGAGTGSSANVATDAAAVRVHSGEAAVSSDAVKTTRLAVYVGSSTIEARGKTQEVTPGFGTRAELGKAPDPPRPLPVSPIWSAPPPALIVETTGGTPAIDAAYGTGSTAATVTEWHVQIARDFAFREIVADRKVPASTTKLEGQTPGLGAWFLRVSAIDGDGFEGPYSRVARVFVMRAKHTTVASGKRRRLEVEPSDVHCVRIGNVRLTPLSGPIEVMAHEPIRLRCAGADGDPTTLLAFDQERP